MAMRSPRPIQMEQVRRRLERWRRTRAYPRAPIPDSLWADAVALARQHGLYETARALPIHYGALKQHRDAADRTAVPRQRSRFVEFTPIGASAGGDCVIEIVGPLASVRIRVHGMGLPDLARLSRVIAGVDA